MLVVLLKCLDEHHLYSDSVSNQEDLHHCAFAYSVQVLTDAQNSFQSPDKKTSHLALLIHLSGKKRSVNMKARAMPLVIQNLNIQVGAQPSYEASSSPTSQSTQKGISRRYYLLRCRLELSIVRLLRSNMALGSTERVRSHRKVPREKIRYTCITRVPNRS